jgi:hypothetical protein
MPVPELPPSLAPLSELVGRWEAGGDEGFAEHWVAAGDVLFGVGFAPGPEGTGFEVLTLEHRDGQVRYVARPGGGAPVRFPLVSHDPASGEAVFLAPEHDDPQRIRYTIDGRRLSAGLGPAEGPERLVLRMRARRARPAADLEAADRAFAAAVAAAPDVDGRLSAWEAAFAPDGSQWDDEAGRRVTRLDGMAEHMRPRLAGSLVWDPVASGLAPAGDLGFTVGAWTWTPPGASAPAAEGAYVTVWARQPDGSWEVRFDTGVSSGS